MNQNMLKEQSVQATMLLPLWGRAKYSRLNPDILVDKEARKIIKNCRLDVSSIEKGFGEFSGICYIMRAGKIDDTIKRYIKNHPHASIVNIGCGLDTTFHRVDNGQIYWYNLDLPEAINFRKSLVKEHNSRIINISRSFLDKSWFDEVKFESQDGILFVAGGVFYYFHERELKKILSEMAEHFSGGELCFDIQTKKSTQRANQMVKLTGNRSAPMHFWVNDSKIFEEWSPKIKVIANQPLFKHIKIKERWNLLTRLSCRLFRNSKMMRLIRLKFR